MLTREPIDDAARSAQPGMGAVASFRGVVRADGENRRVVSIYYDAYPPLANRVVEEIVGESRSRFDIGAAQITHRVGEVPAGEASLLVVVEARHRGECFDALRWIVDEIKVRLPVWKKECYDDGSQRWL